MLVMLEMRWILVFIIVLVLASYRLIKDTLRILICVSVVLCLSSGYLIVFLLDQSFGTTRLECGVGRSRL